MRAILAFLAVPALALAGCDKGGVADHAATVKAGPAIPAPAGGWDAQVAETPEGGFRMGNPDAPAKLVEYASYTCPHCAAFAAEAMPGIRRMVATGRLSYELRSFVRDPLDLAAALLARCGGPESFFPLSDHAFAGQRGLPQAKADQCLSDKAMQDRLVAIRDQAVKRYNLDGTPTFILNGENIGSLTWDGLKPRLDTAVAG